VVPVSITFHTESVYDHLSSTHLVPLDPGLFPHYRRCWLLGNLLGVDSVATFSHLLPCRERGKPLSFGVEPINPTSIYSSDQNFYFYPSDKTIAINPDVAPAILNAQSKEVLADSDLVHFQPIGWTAKQDGVVMIAHEYPCLYGHLACIPQPILLLRQSADHLSPEAQEQFAAKDAQEAQVKQFASIVMFLLIGVSVALFSAILTITFRRSRAMLYT
jgi:hypothetical protein